MEGYIKIETAAENQSLKNNLRRSAQMSTIYSISDIHGCYEAMLDTLNLVDLESDKNNKLLFLGDYISRGKNSCKVLYHIKNLEEKYPDQVVVLIGNHEQMFLDWYCNEQEFLWLSQDQQLVTTKSFFKAEQWDYVFRELLHLKRSTVRMSSFIKAEIKKEHPELLQWLFSKRKEFYYETEPQIYVHAGVYEAEPELWKHATEPYEFIWKYPAETGSFYKDIIAGHISTVEVSNDNSYLGKVFWDGQSHFFIDGETVESNIVPLLKFDTCTGGYSSYEKQMDGSWMEYSITKRLFKD
ncbi:metallophosphoesterase [Oceanobacillus sojae]|nr:metallophosphoesterase [Oceanobacillus sojae]